MPPAPDRPPEPSTLHQAFESVRPLDWGADASRSAVEIAQRHGTGSTWRSLGLLERAAAAEPTVTAQFLACLPPGTTAYQLDRRVKSPESLARKIRDWEDANRRLPIDDLLRYTVLTDTPGELVAAARRTVDDLNDQGWRVTYAMHSYTQGSRYKGLHAYVAPPGSPRTEIQFHSVASVKVKEATTRLYGIERSASATPDERAAARQQCIELSAPLRPPRGIGELTKLGGKRVAVKNYSDSRETAQDNERRAPRDRQRTAPSTTFQRNDGIAK